MYGTLIRRQTSHKHLNKYFKKKEAAKLSEKTRGDNREGSEVKNRKKSRG